MRPSLSRVAAVAAGTLLFAAESQTRPLIIEESQVLRSPAPETYPNFGFEVATNGEAALIASYVEADGVLTYYGLLYRKTGTGWAYQELADGYEREYDSYNYPTRFAMGDNLTISNLSGSSHVLLGTPGNWTLSGSLYSPTMDLELEGTRAAYSRGESWNAEVADLNPDGSWTRTFLQGQPSQPDDENWGGPIDLSGDRVIIGTPYVSDLEPKEIPIYQKFGAAWQLLGKLQAPPNSTGLRSAVALRGDDAIVDSYGGAYVWRLPDLSAPVDRLQAVDALGTHSLDRLRDIRKSGNLVFAQAVGTDTGAMVINVFRPGSNGRYEQVAVLRARGGASLFGAFDVGRSTVMAYGSDQAVYVFDLPSDFSTPEPRYENFEAGAGNWTALAGSQFTVATSGGNRVYRQSSVTGDARALLGDTTWRNQGIEADIRPTAFNGSDRWVGLVTRYVDASNFIYVTLRSSGTVQLRRVQDGAVRELARAPLTVALNRTYRVRLESVGSNHRVYVDGQLLLDADVDASLQDGRAGIAMYRARADYDNVVVSPSPHTTIYARDFSDANGPGAWSLTGTGQWQLSSGAYAQNSTAGDARAVIGTPTDDQVVEAVVRPVSYAAPSGSQERWSGILARYRDTQNYYYLSLRSGHTLSLRKVVNGAITPLASAAMTVTPGTRYRLRLETVGNQLRAYVNGNLVLQATDGALASGAGGLVTFKAAAEFDDYVAYQP
jgi:hypothetical protein